MTRHHQIIAFRYACGDPVWFLAKVFRTTPLTVWNICQRQGVPTPPRSGRDYYSRWLRDRWLMAHYGV